MALTKGQIGIIENWLKRFKPQHHCIFCDAYLTLSGKVFSAKIEECKMNIAGEELTQISITCIICGHISLFDTRIIIL